MAFVAIYDANVLYPSTLRDVLIRIAQGGLVQAKWTDQILDETFRNILKNHPDIPPEKLDRVRALMNAAIRDCLVKGHEPMIDAVELPDPDDRHVLAAAIRAKAQVVVTFNLKDFPTEALGSLGRRSCASGRLPGDTDRSGPAGRLRRGAEDRGQLAKAARHSGRRDRQAGAAGSGRFGGSPTNACNHALTAVLRHARR